MYEVIYECFPCSWSSNPNIISKVTQAEPIYFRPLMVKVAAQLIFPKQWIYQVTLFEFIKAHLSYVLIHQI